MPFVRLLSVFLIGTILGILYPNLWLAKVSYIIILMSLTAVIAQRSRYHSTQLREQINISSTLLFTSIFLLGYLNVVSHTQSLSKTHFSKYLNQATPNIVRLEVISATSEGLTRIKAKCQVISIHQKDKSIKTNGILQVMLENPDSTKQLAHGDIIDVNAKIKEIDGPKNPHEFDYKQYLKYKNSYHSAFINSEHWQLKRLSTKRSIFALTFQLRRHFTQVINQYVESVSARQIAQAILIGNKEQLEQNTIKTYASSGAMHVLAVSGLHVGIVYMVFHFAFIFLDFTRFKKLKPILIVVFIWFYAILTGATPSVLRAATMFSFIALGTSLKQYLNIYNNIASSAFILILINPFVIMEVGFQLSYLAVIGIVYLQSKLYHLLSFQNWLLDKIWTLSTVSIAAQLATFPLGLFYFHQFPNLFWLSNLIVIPAAILIIYLGIALFMFSFSPAAATFIGTILSHLIDLLNLSLSYLNKIPYALSSGIHISLFQCLLLYLIIITLIISLTLKNKAFFKSSLAFLLVLVISQNLELISTANSKYLRVYNIYQSSAIEIQNGLSAHHFFDENLLANENKLSYSVYPNWWAHHLKEHHYSTIQQGINSLSFANKTILVIDSIVKDLNEPIATDYAIITHQQQLFLKEFSKQIIADQYIFDSSNNLSRVKYWKKDCEDLNLNCYFVSDGFAYEEKIK